MRLNAAAQAFLESARVPKSVEPQEFGMWQIERRRAGESILGELGEVEGWTLPYGLVGWPDYTLLRRHTLASMHLPQGEVVMEDSMRELSKHLPIWMAATGRVLKTGLGLGCVVRGLLTKPEVTRVDVVEIDADIIRVIGPTVDDPRVHIHHADALQWDPGDLSWDYAWHDLHSFDERSLVLMHMDCLKRFKGTLPAADRQGAWAFPRQIARLLPVRLIGAPKARACR